MQASIEKKLQPIQPSDKLSITLTTLTWSIDFNWVNFNFSC